MPIGSGSDTVSTPKISITNPRYLNTNRVDRFAATARNNKTFLPPSPFSRCITPANRELTMMDAIIKSTYSGSPHA